jgi:hypothetical protein
MKKLLVLAAGVCLTAIVGFAQMSDIVKVTMPKGAMVGTVKLPAGQYTIRDISDDGNASSVFQIRSDSGTMVVAPVMRISEPDNKRADHTEVVLHRDGRNYQVDKIWFQGRDYGYQLLTAIGHQ